MQTRPLGRTGPDITTVGFGAWAIGGPWQFGWGPSDDDEAIAAIRHALDAGVSWIDTAAVYGLGHSEEVVRRAVEPYAVGDDVLVFTKCGKNWYGSEDGSPSNDLRPDSIRFECEQSLKRLGVEAIDLYQFHWPDPETGVPVEESWGTMGDLVDQGKVRWIGVSNFDVDLLDRIEAVRHVDSLQPPLSLLNRRSRTDVIPWAADHGTGVLVYSPMASGLLTGKYDAARIAELADDDWRKRAPDFTEPQLSQNLAFVDRLRPIAARLGIDLPALVVGWAQSVPGVTAAIVGARRPDQVDGWLSAGRSGLPPEALGEIETALRETDAGRE